MNWQVNYALSNISEGTQLTAEYVGGELIRITAQNQPDVLAAISAADRIDAATAAGYKDIYPELDYLCGYRRTCVWHGEAIEFLERAGIGWGNLGTLSSAALDGKANRASHKIYKFADRLIRQYGEVQVVVREYDRVHRLSLKNGAVVRVGMIAEYEPTADAVRSLWDDFGPMNAMWNINPNGSPTPEAIEAGKELGCEVVTWEDMKEYLRSA